METLGQGETLQGTNGWQGHARSRVEVEAGAGVSNVTV